MERTLDALAHLAFAMRQFAGMEQEHFRLSADAWKERRFRKGEFFNEQGHVCEHLGFILSGVFRSYILDPKNGNEKNVFFFSENQLVVPFKSFVTRTPCSYFTGSLGEACIMYIHTDDLQRLYARSHQWEHFGRLVAEEAFKVSVGRMESLLFRTPEERYLDLIAQHPGIFQSVPLYHLSSYLGMRGPSLSRIRRRLAGK